VRWFAPELRRIKGDLLRADGQAKAAEMAYRDALAEADSHGSRHWAMRIALSMADLWGDTARTDDIEPLLQPLVSALSGPHAPPDVLRAREMLDNRSAGVRSY
jgi:predicted ATPase